MLKHTDAYTLFNTSCCAISMIFCFLFNANGSHLKAQLELFIYINCIQIHFLLIFYNHIYYAPLHGFNYNYGKHR